MAIVVNSDASAFKRTANLPAYNSATLFGWFYIGTDKNDYTSLLGLADSTGGTPTAGFHLSTDVDGTTLQVWNDFAGGTNLKALSTATWYFAAITCAGTGAGQVIGYVRSITETTFTTTTETLPGSFTPAVAEWGRAGYSPFYLDGRIHACGMADVVLSSDELLWLSHFHEPQLRGIRSLNVFYPTIESVNTNATVDRSGNGRNATATHGALADSPPLLWMRSPRIGVINVAAAAGTTRGTPFGHRGTAFNGGRTFHGIIQ